jgi:hypothetical protein
MRRGVRSRARRDAAQLVTSRDDTRVVVRIAQAVHEARTVDRVLAQARVELVDGVGGVGAVGGDGALHAGAAPVQISSSRSRGRTKRTKRSLAWRGIEHRHRVGLVEAGEEIEVGVLAELEVGIGGCARLSRAAGMIGERVADRLREDGRRPLEKGRRGRS